MNSFGERLKSIRKSRGYSQAYLAEHIGVSSQSVSNWECDNTMPDIFQIVPLTSLLKVSTDYLLGVGTNEQEDLNKLNEEISHIWANYSVNQIENNADYLAYEAYSAFLRKYPLNHEIKYKCALAINDYLSVSSVRKKFDIPGKEFDRLYAESEKLLTSICNHAGLPQLLIDSEMALVQLYLLKNKFAQAESVAGNLPDIGGMKARAFCLIAQRKGDLATATVHSEQVLKALQFAYAEALFYRAHCLEQAKADRNEIVIAWEELERFAVQLIAKQPDLSFLTVNAYEKNPYCYLITAYTSYSNTCLKAGEIEQALDCVKKAVKVAIEMVTVAKNSRLDGEVMADIIFFAEHTPRWCYTWTYPSDDNPLTQTEEFQRLVRQITF